MKKSNSNKCLYCGAAVKRASRLRNQYPNDTYMTPTQFECGTVTSENWSPPIIGKNCKSN